MVIFFFFFHYSRLVKSMSILSVQTCHTLHLTGLIEREASESSLSNEALIDRAEARDWRESKKKRKNFHTLVRGGRADKYNPRCRCGGWLCLIVYLKTWRPQSAYRACLLPYSIPIKKNAISPDWHLDARRSKYLMIVYQWFAYKVHCLCACPGYRRILDPIISH